MLLVLRFSNSFSWPLRLAEKREKVPQAWFLSEKAVQVSNKEHELFESA